VSTKLTHYPKQRSNENMIRNEISAVASDVPVKPGIYIKQLTIDENGSLEKWVEIRVSRVTTDSRYEDPDTITGNRVISDMYNLEVVRPRLGSQ
jgi:galactitol-specific phosphotransferase system IIB component